MARSQPTKLKSKPPPKSKSQPKPIAPFLQDKHIQTKPCLPPSRIHALSYHAPLLLHRPESSSKLLNWFDGIASQRAMPWRKPWLAASPPPSNDDTLKDEDAHSARSARSKRAYEVWISEIMLQQTRVSTVIPFYTNWLSLWPSLHDLAEANQDQVLAAWKGLGYYSRATRLHEAAQQIVSDFGGEMPGDVERLLQIKGIGRYTAGAVSSIAFGRAVPLLDGNVARVLARQMGLYGRVKDKKVEDVLWECARVLVERVSGHGSDEEESEIPGRWNQGLMELGSTICTPRPKCGECPIQSTCRAYDEGATLAQQQDTAQVESLADIEDICSLCLPMAPEDLPLSTQGKSRKRSAPAPVSTRATKKSRQSTLDAFTGKSETKAEVKAEPETNSNAEQVAAYAALFPARDIKKAVPIQDSLVCIIQRRRSTPKKDQTARKKGLAETSTSLTEEWEYLIEQRPDKGLLASLWQFPNVELSAVSAEEEEDSSDGKARLDQARRFVLGVLPPSKGKVCSLSPGEVGGCYTHVFTHLRLRMWTFGFVLECEDDVAGGLLETKVKRRWVDKAGVEAATLGTGMQRCWKEFISE